MRNKVIIFVGNDNHFCKIQSIYMQFICEFALENARNSVRELQKYKIYYESANQSQKALL